MSSLLSGKQTVRIFYLVTLLLFACEGALVTHAGIRGAGKYCGVVVFDRWDTCFLLSGHFVTYISDAVKDELRPYKGKAMQIDASDVFQPINPGDALVRQSASPHQLHYRSVDKNSNHLRYSSRGISVHVRIRGRSSRGEVIGEQYNFLRLER